MPFYDFQCEKCGLQYQDVLLTFSQKQDFLKEECPGCGECKLQSDLRNVRLAYIPKDGSPEFERRVMQDRFKKRNERLDALPPENQAKMKQFFNKYGINKTAPSGYTKPPKEKKR